MSVARPFPSRTVARRPGVRCAAVAALAIVAASASASVAAPGDAPIGLAALASACGTTLKTPKLLVPSPVALPDAVWREQTVVRALVSFRLDRAGRPTNVLATASGVDKEAKPAFERAVADAVRRYVFCPAGDFSTTLNWTARLVFSPEDRLDGVYLQSFAPAWLAFGRLEAHPAGRVVVRGVYGPDGRSRTASIVESSGVKVLDERSLDAMTNAQVLFKNGVVPTAPVSIERPFTYQP